MDISAIVLHKLLGSQDLESFSRLKLSFLDPAYSSLYTAISKHYAKYSALPTFSEVEAVSRHGPLANTLEIIKRTEVAEISIDVAIDALIDQYTQNETIRLLDKFVDKLPLYDTAEIKENLAAIALTLDEKTMSTEGVSLMDSFMFFQEDEEISRNRVMTGLNNSFDAMLGGVARQEYIMIGAERGAGKSLLVNNMFINQYESGNTSVYFSIEMTGRETLERSMAMLAGVNYQNLKKNALTPEELLKVVKTRADMFVDANDLVEQFTIDRDKFKFESNLAKTKELKPDNQLIVIDDRALTITAIDIWLGKLKAKFGDKLTLAVVDYINQVRLEGATSFSQQFDWNQQIAISTQLKNLARKYDLVLVSPYQIDKTGEARFGKGILDAADIALVLEAHDKEAQCISMHSTKMRGDKEQSFTSGMDWDTLRLSPVSVERPQKKEKEKKEKDPSKPDKEGNVAW